jgi:hypothetical protein
MPSKTWTFLLNGETHTVTFDFSMLTGWEKVTVDDRVIFNGIRWTIVSRHSFLLGTHSCEAVLRGVSLELTVDGLPFELLPEQALLRASAAPGASADELLRAASDSGTTSPDQLLRSSNRPDADDTESAQQDRSK